MSPRSRGDDDVEQTGFVPQVEEGHSSSRPGSLTVGTTPATLIRRRDTRTRQLYRWVSRTTANTLVNSY